MTLSVAYVFGTAPWAPWVVGTTLSVAWVLGTALWPARNSKFFSPRCISDAKVLCGFHLREVKGVVSSSILSTCSSVRPLVSGTRKSANRKETQHSPPHMKKTWEPSASTR